MSSNRTIVEKADIAVSNLIASGGYLNPMQSNTFIRMMREQPTLMKDVRMVPMTGPTMEINKIGFASRILKAGPASGSALAASDRSAATTEKVELTTKRVIAEIHVPYDVIEDNIEKGRLEDTMMALIAERASLDLEELAILGDTSSGDTFLALVDGVLVQATSHVVDYTASTPSTIDRSLFKAGIKAMPNKYMRNRAAMRFYTSPDVETEYADNLAGRETPLGDTRISTNYGNMLAPFGVPIKGAALMPDSKYLFTYPKNIIVGVQRDIMVESNRDIRSQVLIIVLSMRLDIKFEEEDAAVKCIGLNPNSLTTTT